MRLRNQLIGGITIALAVSAVLTAALGGLGMRREVNQLLDQQLEQVARLSSQVLRPSPDVLAIRTWKRGKRDGLIIVQRWFGNEMVSLVPTRMGLPLPAEAGYRDIEIRGRSWRTYALRTDDGWIVAAQPNEARHELLTGAYWMAVAPALLGLPLAGVLVMLVIRRSFGPLRRLSHDLRHRPALATSALDVTGVPEEVGPLVSSFNERLCRVGTSVERERSFVTDAAHALRTPVTALLLQELLLMDRSE